MTSSLFVPVVPPEKFSRAFATVRAFPGNEPTRLAMDAVFEEFSDSDGNYLEQFQTTGFDARTFELFLFAYFTEAGFKIDRPKGRPDFVLAREGVVVAVEATTSNPTSLAAKSNAKVDTECVTTATTEASGSNIPAGEEYQVVADRPHLAEAEPLAPTDAEVAAHRLRMENELPIKIGSALYSKLRRRYWDLPAVQGRPFVIAVEAFHASDSLFFSGAGLAEYLFGIRSSWEHSDDGSLVITNNKRESHQLGEKQIPSNFFAQPDTENVSAVLFTNSGTTAKFTRMGFQSGLHRGNLMIERSGFWPDPDPNAAKPRADSYSLDASPYEEWWGEGVTVFHNPNAKHPVPLNFFQGATQMYLRGADVVAVGSADSPFISRTVVLAFDSESFTPVDLAPSGVGTLLRVEFDEMQPQRHPDAMAFVREVAWYATKERAILGVVFEDRTDRDYAWAILGRDLNGRFRAIEMEHSLARPDDARLQVHSRLCALRAAGTTIFP